MATFESKLWHIPDPAHVELGKIRCCKPSRTLIAGGCTVWEWLLQALQFPNLEADLYKPVLALVYRFVVLVLEGAVLKRSALNRSVTNLQPNVLFCSADILFCLDLFSGFVHVFILDRAVGWQSFPTFPSQGIIGIISLSCQFHPVSLVFLDGAAVRTQKPSLRKQLLSLCAPVGPQH